MPKQEQTTCSMSKQEQTTCCVKARADNLLCVKARATAIITEKGISNLDFVIVKCFFNNQWQEVIYWKSKL